MKASGVFCDDLFYYKCHKINLSHGGSYVDCSYWIKEKQQQFLSIMMSNAFNKLQQSY